MLPFSHKSKHTFVAVVALKAFHCFINTDQQTQLSLGTCSLNIQQSITPKLPAKACFCQPNPSFQPMYISSGFRRPRYVQYYVDYVDDSLVTHIQNSHLLGKVSAQCLILPTLFNRLPYTLSVLSSIVLIQIRSFDIRRRRCVRIVKKTRW